jgi:hypothetical protein
MKGKFRAFGECPKCHAEIIRPAECTNAFCTCHNPEPTLVPLELALVLPKRLFKRYEEIAELAGVDVERLINKVLEVGCEELIRDQYIDRK